MNEIETNLVEEVVKPAEAEFAQKVVDILVPTQVPAEGPGAVDSVNRLAEDFRNLQGLLVGGTFPGAAAPLVTKAYALLEKLAVGIENKVIIHPLQQIQDELAKTFTAKLQEKI